MTKKIEHIIGCWKITYSRRTRNEFMGRFGGGWNWKIGIQWSRGMIVLSLLICEIIIKKQAVAKS